MITFTKEQLIARINQVTAINKYRIGRDPAADGLAMDNELFAIALASLEAEPVAYIRDGFRADGVHFCGGIITAEEHERTKPALSDRYNWKHQPLYTAPPAPVSVPDDVMAAMQKVARIRLDLNDFDGDKRGILDCLGDAEEALIEVVNRRAAMLQGADGAKSPSTIQPAPELDCSPKNAESPTGINQGKSEPVTTANKLPFEQWLYQQTGTIDVECGCVMTEVFFHWLRVAYEAGNSPVIPDGWVPCSERMPSVGEKVLAYRPDAPESNDPLIKMAKYVGKSAHGHGFDCYCKPSHWMLLPSAPQQEVKNG